MIYNRFFLLTTLIFWCPSFYAMDDAKKAPLLVGGKINRHKKTKKYDTMPRAIVPVPRPIKKQVYEPPRIVRTSHYDILQCAIDHVNNKLQRYPADDRFEVVQRMEQQAELKKKLREKKKQRRRCVLEGIAMAGLAGGSVVCGASFTNNECTRISTAKWGIAAGCILGGGLLSIKNYFVSQSLEKEISKIRNDIQSRKPAGIWGKIAALQNRHTFFLKQQREELDRRVDINDFDSDSDIEVSLVGDLLEWYGKNGACIDNAIQNMP